MESKNLHLRVINRAGVVYDGDVQSISSVNDKGKFDILNAHANFVSILTGPITINQANGTKQQVPATNGVLKATENRINVYLGIKSSTK